MQGDKHCGVGREVLRSNSEEGEGVAVNCEVGERTVPWAGGTHWDDDEKLSNYAYEFEDAYDSLAAGCDLTTMIGAKMRGILCLSNKWWREWRT